MTSIASQRQLILSSDTPVDKAIWMDESSFVIAGYDVITHSVPHGLTFMPLLKAVYSTTPDFSIAYEMFSGPINTDPLILDPFQFYTDCGATTTHAELFIANYTASSTTIYVRFYGYMPTTHNEDVGFTAATADPYVINSDNNYTKLFMSGVTPLLSTPLSTSTVYHNLGYYPQIEGWSERDGKTYIISYTYVFGGSSEYSCMAVYTDRVVFNTSSFMTSDERFHYRIYLDESA